MTRDRREKDLMYRERNKERISKQHKDYYQEHKEEIKAKNKQHYYDNHDIILERGKEYHRRKVLKLRDNVIEHYGGKCVCCGEAIPEFLTIDHMNNNGAKHREEIRTSRTGAGYSFYRWIIHNNYPNDLQLLCYNCNCGKHRNKGVCPHKSNGGIK